MQHDGRILIMSFLAASSSLHSDYSCIKGRDTAGGKHGGLRYLKVHRGQGKRTNCPFRFTGEHVDLSKRV